MVYAGQQEECFNQEAGSCAATVSPLQHMVMEKLAVESVIYITLFRLFFKEFWVFFLCIEDYLIASKL